MIVYKKTVLTLTRKQAAVMKILRTGGTERSAVNIKNKTKYKLLDAAVNPIAYVDPRTFKALKRKKLIRKNNNTWILSPSLTTGTKS